MKTLFIIRHAKSSWDNADLHDMERPLADRGVKDAALMGKMLKRKGLLPDIIISSPALRAISTARLICDELGIDKNTIAIHNTLYSGDADAVLSLLTSLGPDPDSVFIFGHNPVFSKLARNLCLEFHEEMPTGAIVVINFPFENWALVEEQTGTLLHYEYPKKYK